MAHNDLALLTQYAKAFTGVTPEYELLLVDLGHHVIPRLDEVTDNFYATLTTIPDTKPFIESRLEKLKQTHKEWLVYLFTGPYDEAYTAHMHNVGEVHMMINMPVEFMAGGITLIANNLLPVVTQVCGEDRLRCLKAYSAVNAMLGFSLMVMQKSYQSASVSKELERFLDITGFSRPLYNNLARTYKDHVSEDVYSPSLTNP